MSTLLDKKADDVWIKIMEAINAHCANAFLSERLRQILEIQDSGYDAIPLPKDVWCPGVQRVKLNAYGDAFRVARAWRNVTWIGIASVSGITSALYHYYFSYCRPQFRH
jgi:hypothetical protein